MGLNGFTVNFDGFVSDTANFAGGTVNGTVFEFDITGTGNGGGGSVPDLGSSVLLLGLSISALVVFQRIAGHHA